MALQVLGLAVAAVGPVLCIAADKHMTLERAHGPTCDGDVARHHVMPSTQLLDLASHDCRDLSLESPGSRTKDRPRHERTAPGRFFSRSIAPLARELGVARCAAPASPRRTLDSIVLLI